MNFSIGDSPAQLRNKLKVEAPRFVGTTGQPSYTTGWGPFDNNPYWEILHFWKDPFGLVHINGMCEAQGTGSETGTVIFTLPEGYRPLERCIRMVLAGTAVRDYARVDIASQDSGDPNNAGEVRLNDVAGGGWQVGQSHWLSMNISFRVDNEND